jgi:phosphoribosylanthranilate isomerase
MPNRSASLSIGRMSRLESFLDHQSVSLKVCGVMNAADAERLVELGVDAIGVNFWPGSPRHVSSTDAGWLTALEGRILRVGVFVNASAELQISLVREGLLDIVQLHGDETPADAAALREAGIPFIKAIGVKTHADLERVEEFRAAAVLLDAHAPGVYGGTGETFDWNTALDFKSKHPQLPLILAGGIKPENAARAAEMLHPSALDVASGAESSPGVKDFDKVRGLLQALNR